MPIVHRAATCTFQRVAVNLAECMHLTEGDPHVLSAFSHLTRFVIFIAMGSTETSTIARRLIERAFSVFGPLDTLRSDYLLSLTTSI